MQLCWSACIHNTAQTDWRWGAAWFLPETAEETLMNELYTSEMWIMSANVDTSGHTDDIILEVIKKSISEQQFLKKKSPFMITLTF